MISELSERDVRKRNPKRSDAAARKRAGLQLEFEELDKKPNKTPDEKQQLQKLNRAIKHQRLKEKQKSEPHARKGERH